MYVCLGESMTVLTAAQLILISSTTPLHSWEGYTEQLSKSQSNPEGFFQKWDFLPKNDKFYNYQRSGTDESFEILLFFSKKGLVKIN